jgi:7-keto-8-aminopelargonate synthetase-like enzyme
LGFAENRGHCATAAIQASRDFGIAAAATRLEIGTSKLHQELEQLTAEFVGTEDAITFGMGFATNTLNIPSIVGGKGCLVLSDEKNHASIILGIRLSGATVRLFRHNSMTASNFESTVQFMQKNFFQIWRTWRRNFGKESYKVNPGHTDPGKKCSFSWKEFTAWKAPLFLYLKL